eukprot:TRINITY_DN1562_c0_g1_i2.p1 TRINITY_DN1562_c0_g1~~TRINITY_DN1562_c0_g1_i2.p1  ORF type:complete len:173 (-),score=19.81 TRINITY_DN1562_c0_g1_i2:447-965(-)
MNSRRSFYKRREDSRDRDHRRGRYERRRERSRSRSRSRGTKRITNMSELKVSERSDLRELSSEIARRTKLSQPCSIAGIGISCVYNAVKVLAYARRSVLERDEMDLEVQPESRFDVGKKAVGFYLRPRRKISEDQTGATLKVTSTSKYASVAGCIAKRVREGCFGCYFCNNN